MTLEPPPLTYEQTTRVLKRLADLEHEIVLVGGQAVNFWANYYESKVPELSANAPYTSKDIDFFGPHAAVTECAKRLGGKARVATIDDMGTPNTGIVLFVDDDKHERQIDFLGEVAGVERTHETSIRAFVLDDEGNSVAAFRVMHPLLSLRSRAYNVAFLDGYQTEHAKNQLRAAIVCAREFTREMLAIDPHTAQRFNQEIVKIASYKAGPIVYVRYGIDVLEALIDEPGFPERFYSYYLPHARDWVRRQREKAFAAEERASASAHQSR